MRINKHIKLFFYTSLFGFLLFGYSSLEAKWIKIKEVDIFSNDIPASFDGKKLVFISDVHHGPLFSLESVEKMVAKINKLEPDLILLGGDYVYTSPKYIAPVFDAFGKFKARMGVYAVLGNHENRQGPKLTREIMLKNKIFLCDNKSYWVKNGTDSIKVGGVGDFTEDIQIIDNTISDVKVSDFAILLSHNPDYIEQLKTDKIDLTLSGHTHGGQITLLGLHGIYSPSEYGEKYRYGLKKFGKMQSYITSGIGTIVVPLRFFCPPEIVVLRLRKQNAN